MSHARSTTGPMTALLPTLAGILLCTTLIAKDNGPLTFRLEEEGPTARTSWIDPEGGAGTRYEIQRSTDKAVFVTIGVLTCTEMQDPLAEQSFVDRAPLPGVSYYRLRASGTDGSERFSATLPMTMEAAPNGMVAWPNPTQDLVNVVFNEGEHPCSIHIADTSGRTSIHLPMNGTTGTVGIGLGDLPRGTYLVTALMDDGSQQQVRVVKR